MKKVKIAALLLMSGGFTMALGLNCIPNIGFSFSSILNQFGLGGLLGV